MTFLTSASLPLANLKLGKCLDRQSVRAFTGTTESWLTRYLQQDGYMELKTTLFIACKRIAVGMQ